jgi:hypothetical protein
MKILKKEIIDLLGSITQSYKIKRGHIRQKTIFEILLNSGEYSEVKYEMSIPVTTFKTKKHKVDIVLISHEIKTIHLINTKSDAISHTDPKVLIAQTYQEAIEGAKKLWPGYEIQYSILRNNGEDIKEFSELGIKTYNSNDFCGCDIDERAEQALIELFEENVKQKVKDPIKCSKILSLFMGETNEADIQISGGEE